MHHWRQARQRNYTEFYDGMGEPAAIDPNEIVGGSPPPVVWIGANVAPSNTASTLDARLVAFFQGLKRGGDDESTSDETEEDDNMYVGADDADEIDDEIDIDNDNDTLDELSDDNPFDIAIAAADNSLEADDKSPADIMAECGDSH